VSYRGHCLKLTPTMPCGTPTCTYADPVARESVRSGASDRPPAQDGARSASAEGCEGQSPAPPSVSFGTTARVGRGTLNPPTRVPRLPTFETRPGTAADLTPARRQLRPRPQPHFLPG
jgi:hypothetical protein